MAIEVKLRKIAPEQFINDIKKKIDDGEIDTWVYDEDGDFTHSSSQWINKAWMSPSIIEEDLSKEIIFGILGRRGVNLSMTEYSIYHGRFVEVLLKYYSEYISNLVVTTPLVSPHDTHKIDF